MKPHQYYLCCCIFFVTCNISCSTAQKSPADNCIAQVIAADDSLGTLRNHACEKISLSQTIKDYVAGMAAINYKNCPVPFTKAFAAHRQAWENMLPFTDQYPTLRGEMHVLFKQLASGAEAEEFKKLEKAIWDTWAEVEAAMK